MTQQSICLSFPHPSLSGLGLPGILSQENVLGVGRVVALEHAVAMRNLLRGNKMFNLKKKKKKKTCNLMPALNTLH